MPSIGNDLLHGILPNYIGSFHVVPWVPYIALAGILGFILGIVPGLIWIERVVIALMQDRSGPNRVGPRGLLQTMADGVKLFFKEDISPRSVDLKIYYLAPVIAMIPALAGGGTLPLQALTFRNVHSGALFTQNLTVGDVNIGLLYILALSSLQVYGVVLAGWSSNNKYSLLGGLRASAQLISYELAMGLSLLCVVVMAGSLNLNDIVAAQNVMPWPLKSGPAELKGSIFSWYWCQSLFVPVIIYTIAMIAETNRAPFDLPEAESELIAGFHTEYSSMKFAMFFMGEYASMLTVCGLNAAMFWGGPLPPFNMVIFTVVPGVVWFILKVMLGIVFYVWLRATLPRLRYDALMNLGWKRLLPVGLVWLFLIAGFGLVRETGAANVNEDITVAADNSVDNPTLSVHYRPTSSTGEVKHIGRKALPSLPLPGGRKLNDDPAAPAPGAENGTPGQPAGQPAGVQPAPQPAQEERHEESPGNPGNGASGVAPLPVTPPPAGGAGRPNEGGERVRLAPREGGERRGENPERREER